MKIDSNQLSMEVHLQQSKFKQNTNKFKEVLKKESINTKNKVDKGREDKKLRKISKEFESIFIGMMFKEMRKSVVKSDLLDSGLEQEVFGDMYYNKIAESAAENQELGLADAIYQQLSNK